MEKGVNLTMIHDQNMNDSMLIDKINTINESRDIKTGR